MWRLEFSGLARVAASPTSLVTSSLNVRWTISVCTPSCTGCIRNTRIETRLHLGAGPGRLPEVVCVAERTEVSAPQGRPAAVTLHCAAVLTDFLVGRAASREGEKGLVERSWQQPR